MAEAESGFRRAVICKPDSADCYNNLGLAARERNRIGEAVSACRHAIRIRPGFAQAHNNLGLLLAERGGPHFLRAILCAPDQAQAYSNFGNHAAARGDKGKGLAHLKRALRLQPAVAATHYNIGNIQQQDAPEQTALACRGALVCQPDYAQAHNLIGLVLLRLGDPAGAAQCHRRALTCQPDPAFYYNLAAVHAFSAQEGEIAAMERLVAQIDPLTDGPAIALHFALGKAYDDCGDSEKSFSHYQQANRRKRGQIDYDESATLMMMERARRAFNRDLIARMASHGDPSTAPIFILGMPRSGSTLIEQILASHGDVHGGDERPDFPEILGTIGYPEPAAAMNAQGWRRMGAAYVERLRSLAPEALRITDKLPGNFMYAGAIHLALPQARIIHSRRHPADTCVSCYSKLFRDEQQPHTYDLGELGRYYRAYHRLMAHWRSVLPPSVFLDVDYESIIDDPEAQTRRILGHCGLTWDPACLAFHETARDVKTASAAQVRRPIYRGSVGRWQRYGTGLEPLLRELEGL